MRASIGMLALVIAAAPAAASDDIKRPNVAEMKMSDVRAHNELLDRNHRYYIVCRTEVLTGSKVQRIRSCRTREDWTKLADLTQKNVRDVNDRASEQPPPQ